MHDKKKIKGKKKRKGYQLINLTVGARSESGRCN